MHRRSWEFNNHIWYGQILLIWPLDTSFQNTYKRRCWNLVMNFWARIRNNRKSGHFVLEDMQNIRNMLFWIEFIGYIMLFQVKIIFETWEYRSTLSGQSKRYSRPDPRTEESRIDLVRNIEWRIGRNTRSAL